LSENTSSIAEWEIEARLVGSLLARGDSYYELPVKFTSAAIRNATLREAFEAIARRAKTSALPAGPLDKSILASEAGLTDEGRKALILAETQSDYIQEPIQRYAERLMEQYRRASLRRELANAQEALKSGELPMDDVIGRITANLLDLDSADRPEMVSFRDAAMRWTDAVEAAKTGKAQRIRTGFADLDRLLYLGPGRVVILAARAKVGKTTLALQIAGNVAAAGGRVAVHSLEMGDADLVSLTISRTAGIDSMRFMDEQGLTEEEWLRVTMAVDAQVGGGEGNLWFNDYYHSLGAICRITEKEHRRSPLALVVVDYLQLVQCNLGKGFNREQVVATITRTFKLLAMRLGVPILLLSQVNRESDKRNVAASKKTNQEVETVVLAAPKLHELRESGAIEQDANAVLILHNPYAESSLEEQRQSGPFELIVAAQRMGPKGVVRLLGDLPRSQFRPYTNRTEAA
jgi:replicative DNA helicase